MLIFTVDEVTSEATTSSNSLLIYLVIGLGGGLAIVILFTVSCYIYYCMKRRAKRKKMLARKLRLQQLINQQSPELVDLSLPNAAPKSTEQPEKSSMPPSSVQAKETPKPKLLEKNTKAAVTPVSAALSAPPVKKPDEAKSRSELLPDSTQPSLSVDITQPKTESEMTPDELEYLAFSILDSGKRFRVFNSAVKMAEKIAESHGFWVNDRDPTVPGDEEEWLQKDADNLVRACVGVHGIPVPDFGSNRAEFMEFIEKHSLREIYQIALYTEIDDITRLFFLNAVIERFREVVRKLPKNQLLKCQHPIPLLYRIYQENPDVFEFKHKKQEKVKKRRY